MQEGKRGKGGEWKGEKEKSQLMAFFPKYEFYKCVKRYQGDYRVNHFSFRDQFLCMAFAQLRIGESISVMGQVANLPHGKTDSN